MIIERIDRSGHVLQTQSFSSRKLRIGRGYENDLIVNDPYMDETHVSIEFDVLKNTYFVRDLQSTNGLSVEEGKATAPQSQSAGHTRRRFTGKVKNLKTAVLLSGDIIHVGQTRLRVVHEKTRVPAALSLNKHDSFYGVVGTWWLFFGMVFCAMGLYVFDQYLNQPFGQKLSANVIESTILVLIPFVYAGIWLMVAKLQHTEGHFFYHVNVLLMAVVLASLNELVEPIYIFNLGWSAFAKYLSTTIGLLILFAVMYLSALRFPRIHTWLKVSLAAVLPIIVLLMDAKDYLNAPEVRINPSFGGHMVSPTYQWRSGKTTQEFLNETDDLFTHESEE